MLKDADRGGVQFMVKHKMTWTLGWTAGCALLLLTSYIAMDSWDEPVIRFGAPLVIVWIAGLLTHSVRGCWPKILVLIIMLFFLPLTISSGVGPQILLDNRTDMSVTVSLCEMGTGKYKETRLAPHSRKHIMCGGGQARSESAKLWAGTVVAYLCVGERERWYGTTVLHEPDEHNLIGSITVDVSPTAGEQPGGE